MAKPAWEIRRGLIKVRVWQRRSKNGVRYSLTVVRMFRNGDQWKESTRLGRGRGMSKEWMISHDEVERVRNEGLLPL